MSFHPTHPTHLSSAEAPQQYPMVVVFDSHMDDSDKRRLRERIEQAIRRCGTYRMHHRVMAGLPGWLGRLVGRDGRTG